MNQKKPGNPVTLFVFVDTLYHTSERPVTVIIDKSKTILDLRKEFAAKKYYALEEQHWVINGTYCFNEFGIRAITEMMTPFNKGFVAFLLIMTADEKNALLEYYVTFVERRYRHIKPADRWREPEPEPIAEDFHQTKPKPVIGWHCEKCTFLNKPYLKYCDVCGFYRQQDFQIPANYYYTQEDKVRMKEESEREERAKQMEEESLKKLEQDKINRLENLKKMSKESLILSKSNVECPICGEDYEPGKAIVLRNCLHTICKECLKNYLTTINDPEVKCFDVNCVGIVEDQEIQGILNEEEYERYQQLSLRIAEGKTKNTFHCKTSNCAAWVFFDDNVNEFVCQVCQKTNCILCGAIHEEQTCKEYQEELKIKAQNDEVAKKDIEFSDNLINTGKAMYCPGCRIIVQKKRGCDWMKCNMCKTEICWATKGPRWGPGGKGDTSGGCKCKIFARCHPSCKFCH